MSVKILWEKQGLVIKYHSEIQTQEVIDTLLNLTGDYRFEDCQYIISDTSEGKRGDISMEDTDKLVAISRVVAKFNPHIYVAHILSADEEINAISGLYKMMVEDQTEWIIEFFDTEETARQWLAKHLH